MRVWKGVEMSRAWADNSNDVSQLSISHPKGTLSLLTLLLTGEVMSDPNKPYSFSVEMSWS